MAVSVLIFQQIGLEFWKWSDQFFLKFEVFFETLLPSFTVLIVLGLHKVHACSFPFIIVIVLLISELFKKFGRFLNFSFFQFLTRTSYLFELLLFGETNRFWLLTGPLFRQLFQLSHLLVTNQLSIPLTHFHKFDLHFESLFIGDRQSIWTPNRQFFIQVFCWIFL